MQDLQRGETAAAWQGGRISLVMWSWAGSPVLPGHGAGDVSSLPSLCADLNSAVGAPGADAQYWKALVCSVAYCDLFRDFLSIHTSVLRYTKAVG